MTYLNLRSFRRELDAICKRTSNHKVDPTFIVFGQAELSDELCSHIEAQGYELYKNEESNVGDRSILMFGDVTLHRDTGITPEGYRVMILPLRGQGCLQEVSDKDTIKEFSFNKYQAFVFDDNRLHCFFSKGDRKCVALAVFAMIK